jgi:hypothetical protein
MDGIRETNAELCRKILELTADCAVTSDPVVKPETGPLMHQADAIVAHIEVNDHHGVGVLLRRLFAQSRNILSIRSKDYYEGRQQFGERHVRISHNGSPSRDFVFWRVLEALGDCTVGRILCVPYFPDDARTAIALRDLFGAPLCTFLMDDQNLYSNGIPDCVMRELLAKSTLRLGISVELCEGYERKYQYPIWFMPPVMTAHHILPYLNALPATSLRSCEGIIVGNVWGQRWLELLRNTVRDSGVRLQWHCSGEFRWVEWDRQTLARDGILQHEGPALDDDHLIERLRQAPFAVVPSGILDDTDDRRFIAQLSLPSRIPYIFAASQAPILVLGSPKTAAARFVTKMGIGMVAPYERTAFQEAVAHITLPEVNVRMRRAALLLAGRFSDLGAAEWIWESLEKGEPVDSRYQDLRALLQSSLSDK